MEIHLRTLLFLFASLLGSLSAMTAHFGVGRGDWGAGRDTGPLAQGTRLPDYPGDVGIVVDSAVGLSVDAGTGAAGPSAGGRQAGGDDCAGEDKGTMTSCATDRLSGDKLSDDKGECA